METRIQTGRDARLGGETLCLSHSGYTFMALLYFTNITTGSAMADALDSTSQDRFTRLLQGTGSGHTLLNLVLRALFTIGKRKKIVHLCFYAVHRFQVFLIATTC